MNVTYVLVAVSLASIFFLLLSVRRNRSQIYQLENMASHTQPIDLEAFRNLVNPGDEIYLRQHLSPRDLRAVRRKRARAAAEYVRCASRNAAVLAAVGETARRSADPAIVLVGEQLIDSAVRLRWLSFLVLIRFYAIVAVPAVSFTPTQVGERYEELVGRATRLGSLQNYQPLGRISAAL